MRGCYPLGIRAALARHAASRECLDICSPNVLCLRERTPTGASCTRAAPTREEFTLGGGMEWTIESKAMGVERPMHQGRLLELQVWYQRIDQPAPLEVAISFIRLKEGTIMQRRPFD